jgi:hypothetical protein
VRHGIARNNQQRTATERTAQSVRTVQPVRQASVDTAQPAFPAPAPHVSKYRSSGGGGGGDLSGDVMFAVFMLGIVLCGVVVGRCDSRQKKN